MGIKKIHFEYYCMDSFIDYMRLNYDFLALNKDNGLIFLNYYDDAYMFKKYPVMCKYIKDCIYHCTYNLISKYYKDEKFTYDKFINKFYIDYEDIIRIIFKITYYYTNNHKYDVYHKNMLHSKVHC